MFFYTDYNPATDTRSVLSYDEKKHGMPRVASPDTVFLGVTSRANAGRENIKTP